MHFLDIIKCTRLTFGLENWYIIGSNITKANLFIKQRQFTSSKLGVEVPAPVGDNYGQGEGQEDYDEETGVRVGAIHEAEHCQEKQQAEENVQVSSNAAEVNLKLTSAHVPNLICQ